MADYKQVLVIRQKYPDGKGGFSKIVRRGKEIAQGAHGSVKAVFKHKMLLSRNQDKSFIETTDPAEASHIALPLTDALRACLLGSFKKIAVYVDTEEELLALQKQADEAGILNVIVEDSGLTEFHGIKTKTVLAIGPDVSEKIDKITSNLKLL